ncbi:MAG: hypothetical protein U9Q81_22030, partial [Pseudomonadota bacterium]|nr:hypothetical protein [Pseudomonadota bacterium]
RDYGGGDTSNETEEAAEENETEQAFEGDADSAIADELDAADGRFDAGDDFGDGDGGDGGGGDGGG